MLALVFVLILNTAGVFFDQLSGQFNQYGDFIRYRANAGFKFREIAYAATRFLTTGASVDCMNPALIVGWMTCTCRLFTCLCIAPPHLLSGFFSHFNRPAF